MVILRRITRGCPLHICVLAFILATLSAACGSDGPSASPTSGSTAAPAPTHTSTPEAILQDTPSPASTQAAIPTPTPETEDSVCRPGLIVRAGESCTYKISDVEFWVDSSGRGHFLFFTSGGSISKRNATINGQVYNFEANKLDDGTWRIEAAGYNYLERAPSTPTSATSTPSH